MRRSLLVRGRTTCHRRGRPLRPHDATIDWPRYGDLIARAKANGTLKKHGPCPALRFIANSLDGPPRIGQRPRGRRTAHDHYADMHADAIAEEAQ